MELVHGEMTTIAAILAAAALIMVPTLGFTLRHTIPPVLEALARTRTQSFSAERTATPHDSGSRTGKSRAAAEIVAGVASPGDLAARASGG